MPIEFTCPGCGKQMRAPDAAAGKKGQCPQCSTKVQIPAASAGTRSGTTGGATGGGGAGASRAGPASASGPIRFACGSCGKQLSVPAANAGKKGKCPQCGAVLSIPAAGGAKPSAKWKGAPGAEAAGSQSIQFACPGCRKAVRVAGSAAGKRGKCPHCQTVFQIPQAASRKPGGDSGLQPLGGGGSGLAPLGNTGSDLFGGEGLTPVGDAGSDFLGSGGGLQPLGGSDPFADVGLGPAANDPFAAGGGLGELGGGDPWAAASAPQAPINPYSSPVAASSTKPRSSGSRDKRKGLPWDREMSAGSFFSTVGEIASGPSEAFKVMKRYGGFGAPILYSLIGGTVGGIASGVVQALMVVIDPMEQYPDEIQVPFGIGMFFYVLVASLVGATVGIFINAGIFHLPLMLLGSKQPYETTLRVVAYMSGTIALFQLIPVFGGCVAVIYSLIILIAGMAAAHGISVGKAFGAYLLSIAMVGVICGAGACCLIGVVGMSVPTPAPGGAPGAAPPGFPAGPGGAPPGFPAGP